MSQATVRAAIKTALEGVTNIGKVHDYVRLTTEWSHEDFLNLFKTTIDDVPQVLGWMIEYKGFQTQEEFNCGKIRLHSFQIHGYNRVNDSLESEKTFAALVETVGNTFDADNTIHATSLTPAANAPTVEFRMFGDVLCHYCLITQQVVEEV